MSVIQVRLPKDLRSLIDRHVAEGRTPSQTAFFIEASPGPVYNARASRGACHTTKIPRRHLRQAHREPPERTRRGNGPSGLMGRCG